MYTNLSTRYHKIFFVFILSVIILLFSSPGVDAPLVHAQDGILPRKLETFTVSPDASHEQGRYYRAKTFALSNGTLVTGHTINGPSVPLSGLETERQAVALPQPNGSTLNVITGITANASGSNGGPLYLLGCSPTAISDILKTDEGSNFPNTYPGIMPADGSLGTFTDNQNVSYTIHQLIATLPTMEALWDSYQSIASDPNPGGQDLSVDQVGPLMRSSVYDLGDFDQDGIPDHNYDGDTMFFTNGAPCPSITVAAGGVCALPSRFTSEIAANENLPDGTLGIRLFYEARGYKVAEAYNQPTDNVVAGGFSFAQFKAEIDAGRAVMMHLGGESGKPGHSIVGIGYDASTNLVYLHDGWDYNIHTMTWGGNYPPDNIPVPGMPLMMVSIIHPIPPDHPGDYTISGYVGVPNATITYPGGSTKSDSGGYYSISVSPGWTGRLTPSKPGYTFQPKFTDYSNVPAYQTKQNYTATVLPAANLVQDPSFELGRSNPYWAGTSTYFGTPLCDASCGQGARTGSVWGWFGGIPANETATLSQTVTIPKGSASLDFYLWIDEAGAGSDTADVFTAKVDGTTVFSANATQINSYSTYIPVSVNISAYADGAPHVITFGSVTTSQVVSFQLDDVFLASTPNPISGVAGVGGAILSYTDGTPKTVTADGSGNYTFNVPSGWTGTVTPGKACYTFTPPNRSYSNVIAEQPGQDYTTTYNASAYTLTGNTTLPGVTLSYTNGTPQTTVSDGSGNYTITVPCNWNGTLTPSKTGYLFAPAVRNYSTLTSDKSNQNFNLYNVAPADFNGDGQTDVAVFRPSNSTWYIYGQGPTLYGQAGDIPTPADYNGDGKDDLAVFRPSNSTWYIYGQGSFAYGQVGDIPVVADYNGDGKADIAVFRPSNSTWYIYGVGPRVYGQDGDIPVVADYNGDGKADIAVFRPSNSTWYLYGIGPRVYGTVGDIPVIADYNGDGKADVAVFRPTNSTWYIYGIGPSVYGTVGDIPAIGDYNGDGKADITVFRPTNSTWYKYGVGPSVYGTVGDIPV